MKKNLTVVFFVISTLLAWGQEKSVTIKGKISDGNRVIEDVNISLHGSDTGTLTDENGAYKLSVPKGSVLRYTHLGYEPVEIIIEDLDRTLNIIMVPKVNQLDAVTVTKTKPRKTQKELFQEYDTNPNLIKTMFGILDKETSATALYVLDEEDFPPGALDVVDLINGRIPGARGYKPTADPATWFITMRGNGSINFSKNSIYEIDGLVFEEFPYWLDVSNIKRIATMPSLAGVLKYGSMANGGLVVINTKTGNFSPGANGIANYDQAKLRNNTYTNDAVTAKEAKNDIPSYLKLLQAASSLNEAENVYQEELKVYKGSLFFILDAYEYFSNRWKNREFADGIIEENRAIFNENPLALKSLAYLYQAEGRNKEANELFKEIFILRPNYSQSYLDLANGYREIGEYQRAAAIFARYGYLLEQGFLRTGGNLGIIMDREFNNLLALKGRELLSNKNLKNIILDDEFDGTRIVFEWNDGEAEFELQFVNPEGNYFKWEHSLMANAERVKEEKLSGFSTEEYLIDDSIRGTWQVNATYFGNKSLTPTYLKATVYHNYGTASQRKETKVFKLSLRNVNQQLFTVSNAASVVSN